MQNIVCVGTDLIISEMQSFILDVANFKKEGLVTPEGWEEEKENSKICWSMQEIETWSFWWNAKVLHYTILQPCYKKE